MQVGDSFCFHVLETINVFPTFSEFSIALSCLFPEKGDETEKVFPFSSDISCCDINTLLHLRACLVPHPTPSLVPHHKGSSLSMSNVPLPYFSASLTAALIPVQSLPSCWWAGICFPSITSLDLLHWPVKPHGKLDWFHLGTMQSLESCITRTQSSPVIHIWSSTKFPQVWGGTNFSGSFLCAWGHTKSSWTLQHQMRPGLMASSHLRVRGFHCPCESYRNPICKPPSLCQTAETVWQCQKLLGGMDRHTGSGETKSKSVLWTWIHESALCLGYREVSGVSLFSRTQQSWDVCQGVVYCLLLQINFSFLATLWLPPLSRQSGSCWSFHRAIFCCCINQRSSRRGLNSTHSQEKMGREKDMA